MDPDETLRRAWESVRVAVASAAAVVPEDDYALVRARMADLLGVDDPRPGTSPDPRMSARADWPDSSLFSQPDRVLMELTEQFVLDVSGVSDAQRAETAEALGPLARTWPAVLHTIDLELRVVSVLTALGVPAPDLGGGEPAPLPAALNTVTREVSLLSSVDPLTTELVRLRCARVHDCRMCKSLRHADALDSGGDEDLYDDIDRYDSSTALSEAHKVALRLTDAVLFSPAEVPPTLAQDVRRHFSGAQAVELVLDVERNARNKVAVANGTDGDGVGEGLTRYTTDARGGFALVDAGPGASDPRGRF